MGFSRRHAKGQRREQAERLAILLSEIAARQAETPTARVQMLKRTATTAKSLVLPVSAFAAGHSVPSWNAKSAAFHERIANAVATENQET